MRALWVTLCVTLIIAFVEAQQRNLNLPKPVGSLEKQQRPSFWRRPAEERRKLSIFPKNNKKFMITERPIIKKEVTKPVVTTKRPVMKKLVIQDNTKKNTWSYSQREPLITPKQFNLPMTPQPKRDKPRIYKSKNYDEIAEESTIKTVVTSYKTEAPVNSIQLNKGNLIKVLNRDKLNVAPAKVIEQANKMSSGQINKVIQNNNFTAVNFPDKVFKEPAIDVSTNSIKEIIRPAKIEEQVDELTERVILSKQVDNMIQNNESSHANSLVTVSAEIDSEEIYYDHNEVKMTPTSINEQVNVTTEKVFLSKQINNITQNNNILKVNLPDNVFNEHAADENDAAPAEIIKYEENESTTHILTGDLLNLTEPFEGRSLESNELELNNQSEFLISNNKQSLNEKKGDSSNLNDLEALVKVIAKDFNNDSDQKPSIYFSNADPLVALIQNINKETVKSQTEEYEELNNLYEIKPITYMEEESKNSTDFNLNAAVTEVKETIESTEIKTNYTNIETNQNSINVELINDLENLIKTDSKNIETNQNSIYVDLTNDLENLMEVIKINSTSEDSGAGEAEADSELLRPDLNIVEEYTESIDTILSEYNDTMPVSGLYDILTESPIEVIFDNIKTLNAEEQLEGPSLIGHLNTGNVISIVYDPVSEISENIEDGGINITEIIKEESAVSGNDELAKDETQLVNLDMNIVEEYSEKPNMIATKLDESTQESYLINEALTESPINIFFYNQEAPSAEKITFEPIFEENIHIIADKSVSNELSIASEIIRTIDMPVTEFLLKTENTNANTISPNDDLNVEENHSKNNANSTIRIIIPNADEVVNYGSNIGDNGNVTIGEIELLKHHLDIVDEDIDKHISITTVVDETLTTQRVYVEDEYETVAPKKKLLNDLETSSTDPLLDMYTNKVTDELVADQFHVSEKIITVVEKTVKDILQEVKDGNTSTTSETEFLINEQSGDGNADSPNIVQIIDDYSIVNDTTDVVETQSLNLHINIVEENQPTTITIFFDEMTQKVYLNGNHVDDAPIGILFDNLEPLGPNNKEINRPISEIPEVPETDPLNSNNEDVQSIEKPSNLINEEISDARLVASSNPPSQEISMVPININSNNIQSEERSDESKEADQEISVEYIVDNVINLSDEIYSIVIDGFSSTSINEITDEISNESIVFDDNSSDIVTQEAVSNEIIADQSKNLTNESSSESSIVLDDIKTTLTNEEISDEIIAESDQSKKITDDVSNELIIFNDNTSYIVTQEAVSNEIIAEQSKNLTNESSSESSIVFDDTRTTLTNEEISDEIIAEPDQSKKITDDVSNEFIIFNDNTSYIVTQEDISDEIVADQSKNMTDESSSKSSIVFDDSRYTLTNEEISHEIIAEADQSRKMADNISNELIILNDNTSHFVTQKDISDVMIADQSKNMADESSSKSSIVFDDSRNTLTTEMSDEIIAETDQSRKITDKISNELIIFNDNTSHFVTQEDMSDAMIADQSKNMADKSSSKSSIVFDDSRNTLTNEMSDEIIAETDQSRKMTDKISNELIIFNDNTSHFVTQEDISDAMIADQSKNMADESSNKSSIVFDDSRNTLTNEMSDEIIAETDQSNKFADEISKESIIFNDSSSEIVTQENISDEIIADQSKNMTDESLNKSSIVLDDSRNTLTIEEMSDEIITEAGQSVKFTDGISNESIIINDSLSDIVTQEDISDEMTADQSKNLTDESSSKSSIVFDDSRNTITNEEMSDVIIAEADQSQKITDGISNESIIFNDSLSDIVTQEDISDEMIADQSKNLTDESSRKSSIVFDDSRNTITNEDMSDEIIAETDQSTNSNDSDLSSGSYSSVVTSEEISDEIIADQSKNISNENSSEPTAEVVDLTNEQKSENLSDTKNMTGEDVSNGPAIDIRHPSSELASNEMLINRIKRSNNIIEEENLATNLSGFKYTGHETRLGHDLSFKNINA